MIRYTAKDVLADPDEVAHNIIEMARRRCGSAPSVGFADTSPAGGGGA